MFRLPPKHGFFYRLTHPPRDAFFILVFNRKKTIIIEDGFRKTRRRTPLGWRLVRTTTKYCGNQTNKKVEFLLKNSIKNVNTKNGAVCSIQRRCYLYGWIDQSVDSGKNFSWIADTALSASALSMMTETLISEVAIRRMLICLS